MKLTKKLITIILLSILILAALAYSISRLYAMAGLSTGSTGNSGTTGGSLTKGLVGHWNLDSESYNPATKRFTDKSAFSNHGTSANAATFTTDHKGQADRAMTFNGTSDYVNAGNAASLKSSVFTYSAWVKPVSIIIGTIKGGSAETDGAQFRISDGYLQLLKQGMVLMGTSNTVISLNTWSFVAVSYNSSGKYNFYINGNDAGSGTNLQTFIFPTNTWIGSRYTAGAQEVFKGSIDEVRIYNRALSAEEVKMSYDAYRPKFSAGTGEKGLVGHWNLDSESYNPATKRFTDKSAFSNHGTSANAAGFTADHMGQADRAMTFNGTSDYVDAGNGASLQFGLSDITISMWIKVNPSSLVSGLLAKGGDVGRFWIVYSPNTLRINSYFGAGLDFWLDSNINVNNNAWHHVVGTFDRDGYEKIYVDGIYSTQQDISAASSIVWNPSDSVSFSPGTYNFFSGSIDEVRIYNRALSAEEILAQYNAYRPKFSAGSLQKGLVLDMPMTSTYTKGGAAGSEILTDRTPYSNNGQNYGATVSADFTTFDGVDDYVDAGNAASLNFGTYNLSVSLWFKTSTGGALIMKSILTSPYTGVYISVLNNKIYSQMLDTSGSPYPNLPGIKTINDGVWHNLIITRAGTLGCIYVDGILDISGNSYENGSITTTTNLIIGSDLGSSLFNGSIDEVRIYNRALSAEEIQLSYDQSKGRH